MSSRGRGVELTVPKIRLGLLRPGVGLFGAGEWSREVEVGDRRYRISLRRGQRVRIAFKPAGKNWGHRWVASAWRADARPGERSEIWSGEVGKSTGSRGILLAARVVTTESKWWRELTAAWFWIGAAIHRKIHPGCASPEDGRFGRTERFEREHICQLTCSRHEEGYERCPWCGAPFKRRPAIK